MDRVSSARMLAQPNAAFSVGLVNHGERARLSRSATAALLAEQPAPATLTTPHLTADGDPIALGPATVAWVDMREAAALPEQSCRLLFDAQQGPKGPDMRPDAWQVALGHMAPAAQTPTGLSLGLIFPTALLSRALLVQLRQRGSAALPLRGAAAMCLELARACLSQPEPVTGHVANALGESLIELAKLALIETHCDRRVESVRETVRARIQAFVQRNLVDPDLTLDRIAERMQCTKRYLHKVFSDEGQTLNQYIWAQRLERCRDELCRAEQADKSITEIAYACGFRNAAHFNRSFRTRFGQPPRAYRKAMLQD